MSKRLYVVLQKYNKRTGEAHKILAICTERGLATIARNIIHKRLSIPCGQLKIKSVIPNTIYPHTIMEGGTILIVDLEDHRKEVNANDCVFVG